MTAFDVFLDTLAIIAAISLGVWNRILIFEVSRLRARLRADRAILLEVCKQHDRETYDRLTALWSKGGAP